MIKPEKRQMHTENYTLDASRILYIDEQCIALNKRAGEAVEGAGAGMGDLPLMIQYILDREKNCSLPAEELSGYRLSPPVAVHRLDVPVTGCALFARTQGALAFLNGVFIGTENAGDNDSADYAKAGAPEKYYWAIIEKPRTEIAPAAHLVHWVQLNSRQNKSMAFDEPGQERKKAELAYRIIGAGRNYLFMEIQLFTGRHHQIRCQLAHIGLHIKGDLKYGARRSEPGGGIRLHARSLAFPHPAGGGRISIQADPPHMDNLWQAFGECVVFP